MENKVRYRNFLNTAPSAALIGWGLATTKIIEAIL